MKTRVYFSSPLELRNHMEDRCIAALCVGPGVPYQDLSHPTALGLGRLLAVACTVTWCRLVFGAAWFLVLPGFSCLREMAAEEGEKRENTGGL